MRSQVWALGVGALALLGGCTTCIVGETACDDGCRDLASDVHHCGACGHACGGGEVCAAGVCTPLCDSGQTRCGDDAHATCVDLLGDVSNCGACGYACPAGPSSTVTCSVAQCRWICAPGFGRCDAQPGCHTRLDTVTDCGACGAACGAGQECVAGQCQLAAPPPAGRLPVVGGFQWQGSQQVLQPNGSVCSGRIAVALTDQAVCYAHLDGSLRCAGAIGPDAFGPQFVPVPGVTGVDQILLSPSTGSGNSICVHQKNLDAWCMGGWNASGQLGTGSTQPVASFTRWTNAGGLTHLATGTWDAICALDLMGVVRCVGGPFGPAQMFPAPGTYQTMWLDTSGMLVLDNPAVLRASAGRSECVVTPSQGLHCSGMIGDFGAPGHVVDGSISQAMPMQSRACWLTDLGQVACSSGSSITHGVALALAANFATDDLCAVLDDASLWCLGTNSHGELGTGDTQPVTSERMVQPPGSVALGCP